MTTPTGTPPGSLAVAMTVEQLWQPVPGGSGTYIVELAGALAERPDVAVTGLAARHGGPPAGGLPGALTVDHSVLPRRALYELWHQPRYRSAAARRARERADRRPEDAVTGAPVLHATTWAVPPRTAPLVVTVHDLAFLREPGHFTARGNAFFRQALEIVAEEADIVVVPSATTAKDCVEAGLPGERIRVIPHGVRAATATASELAAFKAEHGLARPYVLWCGTLEPRKNLGGLLDAYALLLADGADVDLVLAGPTGWGGADHEVADRLQGLPDDRVHLLGRLGWPDLHRAYAGAEVLCYPSLWEGFGLPVIEAMAHGTPVVTSTGTSTAELVTRATGRLADPVSPERIATALAEVLAPGREAWSAAAKEHAAGFTWAACAEAHVAAYRDAVERDAAARGTTGR